MAKLHTITCPSVGSALFLAIVLEHEGRPSYWNMVDGKPTVVTMADTQSVNQALEATRTVVAK
jgi:hypothetical protein